MEPIELMERLAAQIPKPRVNMVLYAGVLAPNAKLRAQVVRYTRPQPLPEPGHVERIEHAAQRADPLVQVSTLRAHSPAIVCGDRRHHSRVMTS